MHTKQLAKILTGTWQDDLLKLPLYQRKAIKHAYTVLKPLDKLKFGIINVKQLQKELQQILKPKK